MSTARPSTRRKGSTCGGAAGEPGLACGYGPTSVESPNYREAAPQEAPPITRSTEVPTMLEGRCLCGSVGWTLRELPRSATACSCTACRRYGTLWAYGWEGEDITFFGETASYARGEALSFHFCPRCGNVSHWWGFTVDEQGRRRVAVNLRLTEPGPIEEVPVRHFDGLDSWEARPQPGRCVKDLWF